MLRFSINLNRLFGEFAFMDRFCAAAKAGFKAVEFAFPYGYSLEKLKDQLTVNQLELVRFNLPAGNWMAGDRGIAVNPRRQVEFKHGVHQAIVYAQALDVRLISCLIGKPMQDIPQSTQYDTVMQNLQYAADELNKVGCRLLIEPLHAHDMPVFFLDTTQQAVKILKDVNRPNIYLQYSLYHARRIEGEFINTLQNNLGKIGHIQITESTEWYESGVGKATYWNILKALERFGYNEYVGLNYIPSENTWASLEWIQEYAGQIPDAKGTMAIASGLM